MLIPVISNAHDSRNSMPANSHRALRLSVPFQIFCTMNIAGSA
jgi:hypothetical protein